MNGEYIPDTQIDEYPRVEFQPRGEGVLYTKVLYRASFGVRFSGNPNVDLGYYHTLEESREACYRHKSQLLGNECQLDWRTENEDLERYFAECEPKLWFVERIKVQGYLGISHV